MSLMVSTGAEPKAPSDLVKYEAHQSYTRAHGIYLAGDGAVVDIELGTVLGRAGRFAIAAAAPVGAGNGSAGSVVLLAGAQVGVYDVEFLTATTFAVYDPKGARLADGAAASAYASQIGFTVTAGGAAFEAGDSIAVTVTESAGKYVPLDLSAVDGSQIVAAVSLSAKTIPDGADGSGLVLVRGPATVVRNHLVYPAGATTAQKAAIEAALDVSGIRVEDAI